MIGERMPADEIKRRINLTYENINTMYVGSIVSVDPVNMNYSVQPVINDYDSVDGEEVVRAIMFECPMMISKSQDFYIRIPYKVGDLVYVGVCKESADESVLSNQPHTNRARGISKFRMVDGIILGGVMMVEEPRLSSSNTNDLLIQNRKTNCKMVMLEGGGFEFITDFDITTKSKNVNMDVAENFNVKCKVANIEASSSATIKSPTTTVTGNLSVGGGISGAGDLSLSGKGTVGAMVTNGGVSLDGHTHTYNPGPNPPTNTSTGKG
ncbi:MAG: Gp138 family membrane-puncturing spike protein [Paraclostridium sp.]